MLALRTQQVRSLAEAFACRVVPILTGLCSEGRSALITIVSAGTGEPAFPLDPPDSGGARRADAQTRPPEPSAVPAEPTGPLLAMRSQLIARQGSLGARR